MCEGRLDYLEEGHVCLGLDSKTAPLDVPPKNCGAHSGQLRSHHRLKPEHLWEADALCRMQRRTTWQVA